MKKGILIGLLIAGLLGVWGVSSFMRGCESFFSKGVSEH